MIDVQQLLGHLTLNQDLVLVSIPLLAYGTKAVINPSKFEASILTRLLLPFIVVVIKKLIQWNKDHPHAREHLVTARDEVSTFKDRVLSRKALG